MRRIYTDFFKPIGEVLKAFPGKGRMMLLYLVIPMVFLLNVSAIHFNKGRFFMGNTDPEYFFLYNGALIGSGHLGVPYTSNPGTPLMVLIAASSRAVGFFQPGGYIEDIVNDPEKYIHAAHLTLAVLLAAALFFCGWYIYKVSGSWVAGLLMQLTLPASNSLMMVAALPKAETMTILPVLLLCIAIVHYIYTVREGEYASGRMLALFGMICGLGLASKLIFIPLVLIPLMLLKTTFRQKLQFLLYTVLAFAVFAYPVVLNKGDFWGWIGGIVSHTGKYGEGQQGFIDMAALPVNLKRLYDNDRAFFILTGLALLIGAVWVYVYPGRRAALKARLTGLSLLAVAVAIVACIALDLKHFEVHYFFPIYVLKFFMVALIYLLIVHHASMNQSRLLKGIAVACICIGAGYMALGEIRNIRSSNDFLKTKKETMEEEYRAVMSVTEPGSPVILSGRYYGTPFVEFAHYDGYKMANIRHHPFKPYLKAKYPVTYQYVSWADKFYYWGDYADFNQVLENTVKSFYVFLGEKKEGDQQAIEDRLWKVIGQDAVSREIVYRNAANGDQLIRYTMLGKAQ